MASGSFYYSEGIVNHHELTTLGYTFSLSRGGSVPSTSSYTITKVTVTRAFFDTSFNPFRV